MGAWQFSAERVVSNTITFLVAERVDVVVTPQSGQVVVLPNGTARSLLFTVTNTGNGTETYQLAINSIVVGDDFDPIPSLPDTVFFDTDGSGNFNTGDVAYVPGGNGPILLADESVDVLLVNDIPASVTNGDLGRSELIAAAATGSGVPGTVYAGLGDGGTVTSSSVVDLIPTWSTNCRCPTGRFDTGRRASERRLPGNDRLIFFER